jgi:hypothetical protein
MYMWNLYYFFLFDFSNSFFYKIKDMRILII